MKEHKWKFFTCVTNIKIVQKKCKTKYLKNYQNEKSFNDMANVEHDTWQMQHTKLGINTPPHFTTENLCL